MFHNYTTCETVNRPVRDAVYYRLKSILRRAVRPGLVSPDWETNLYFCGVVNKYQNNHSAEAALDVIYRRLASGARRMKRSNRTTYLSLILLETCMKNCGTRFHYVAADERLFKVLLRLARPRISGKRMHGGSSGNYMRDLCEERVLLLVQAWGKAFEDRDTGRMSTYSYHYDQLRRKGVRFPPERPEDEVFTRKEKEAQGRASRTTKVDEQEIKSILNPLKESMDVLEEMLNALGPRENPEKDSVIQSLVALCKDAKPRVIKLIDRCVDDENLTEYLMNTFDRLEELLSQYDTKCGRTSNVRPLKYETARPKDLAVGKKSSTKSRRRQSDSDSEDSDMSESEDSESVEEDSDDDWHQRGAKGGIPKEKRSSSLGTLSRKRSSSLPPRTNHTVSASQLEVQKHYDHHQQLQQQQRVTQSMTAPFAPVAFQQHAPYYGSAQQQPQSESSGAQHFAPRDDFHRQQLQMQQQMQRLQLQRQSQQLQQAIANSPASPLSPRGGNGPQYGGSVQSGYLNQPGPRVMDVGRMSTEDFNKIAAQGFKGMDTTPAAPSPTSSFSLSAPSLPSYGQPISPPHSAMSNPQQQQQQYAALYQQQLALQQQQQFLRQQQQQQQQQQQWGSSGAMPQATQLPSNTGTLSLLDSDLDFLASVGSSGKSSGGQQRGQSAKSAFSASLPSLPSGSTSQSVPHYPLQQGGSNRGPPNVGLPPPPAAQRSRIGH